MCFFVLLLAEVGFGVWGLRFDGVQGRGLAAGFVAGIKGV